MSDWWARKLGGDAPQRQPEARQYYVPAGAPPRPSPPPAQVMGPGAVTMENFGQMVSLWQGGPGRANTTHCPNCGADTLFRRRVGMQEAAPLCYSCGFNGMYQQADPANWQA